MDMFSPGLLISGLIIGTIGFAVFLYGKKTENFKCLGVGLVLCVYPYFVSSVLMLWLIAALCLAGLYVLAKFA